MRTAKEIINEFKAIADNPRKAMDDYKKETGKGAVGIMPVYCPEEIVHAAGVKNLYIEVDQESTAFEQVKTRIQTFAEIL